MLPLPPIGTGHDSSKSSSFKPCASRARAEPVCRNQCDATEEEKIKRSQLYGRCVVNAA